MAAPWLSRASGQSRWVRPDYATMADWELDLCANERGILTGQFNQEAMAEQRKRSSKRRLDDAWSQMQREGFGL